MQIAFIIIIRKDDDGDDKGECFVVYCLFLKTQIFQFKEGQCEAAPLTSTRKVAAGSVNYSQNNGWEKLLNCLRITITK